ncbi:unnamed protein product [Plutella xylostella]|uniref:(diamondback moth) hypothetical protein n=1 Tax=Plutella xylostella TaxID=51655 RepID=A0A8S4D9Z5_PLUXY|nr:unnamed protein product [Plutella xylostella]
MKIAHSTINTLLLSLLGISTVFAENHESNIEVIPLTNTQHEKQHIPDSAVLNTKTNVLENKNPLAELILNDNNERINRSEARSRVKRHFLPYYPGYYPYYRPYPVPLPLVGGFGGGVIIGGIGGYGYGRGFGGYGRGFGGYGRGFGGYGRGFGGRGFGGHGFGFGGGHGFGGFGGHGGRG